jgi:hypothetical protein
MWIKAHILLKIMMMNAKRNIRKMTGFWVFRSTMLVSVLMITLFAGEAVSQSPDSLIVTDDIAPPGDTALVAILLHNTQYSVGGFSTRFVLADSLNASFQRAERGEDVMDFDHFNVRISDGACKIVGIADLPGGGSPSPLGIGLHELARVFIFIEETAPWGVTDSLFFMDDTLPPERDNSISDSTGYINEVPSLIGGQIIFDLYIGTDDDLVELPSKTGLRQNYPNPFNAETTIRFELAEDATGVSLSIYDLMGRRLRWMSFGSLAPGSYDFVWNGKDNEGMAVASGIYFYRLEIGSSFVETRRMTLLK